MSEDFKKRLISENIDPNNVDKFITYNDRKRRKIITKLFLKDGKTYNLVDNFIWYAARKDKKW